MPGPVMKRSGGFPMPESVRGLVETAFPPDELPGPMGMGVAGPLKGGLGWLKGLIKRPAASTIDIVDDIPVRQMAPSMGDVDALTGDLRRNLARVPSAARKPLQGVPSDTLESAALRSAQGIAGADENASIAQHLGPWLDKLRRR